MKRSSIFILGGVILAIFVGVGIWMASGKNPQEAQGPSINSSNSQNENTTPSATSEEEVVWEFDGRVWRVFGIPPACPNPLVFRSPVDVNLATSILYPGQERGGNYKPHGGFRFDTIDDNRVNVTVPMDGVVVNGARYLVGNETQYTFDIIAPCGIKFRLGHLLKLTPAFTAIVENFPPAREGDSRTTQLNPVIPVTAGDLIATEVGVIADTNTFVDFGVYDLRQSNDASNNGTWATQHADDYELAWHGICWFDDLPEADRNRVKNLPAADPTSGAQSDYCK